MERNIEVEFFGVWDFVEGNFDKLTKMCVCKMRKEKYKCHFTNCIIMEIVLEPDLISETKYCIETITQNIENGSISYSPENSEIFYAIGCYSADINQTIIDNSKESKFWLNDENDWINDWLFDDPYLVWFLLKIGCANNEILLDLIEDVKKEQTIEGKIQSNTHPHVGILRILAILEPESVTTKSAIQYFINNWQDFEIDEMAIGIFALSEINYFEYKDTIHSICYHLLLQQNEEGYFGEIRDHEIDGISKVRVIPFDETAYAVMAISRFVGVNHNSVKKGLKWLIANKQNEFGVISNYHKRLGLLLFTIISIGGGPKISLADYEWQQTLHQQRIDFMKPIFLHTSPLYQSNVQVRELLDVTSSMLKNGKKKIRISSLFIDMLYEDLINLANNNPELEIKIITRPSSQIKGMREKIARNVLQLLNIATKGNLKTNEFVHSRMIIIDENELIVSSSDLTRDQLFDEFNAGIYTKDKDCIADATKYFDNLWDQSENIRN